MGIIGGMMKTKQEIEERIVRLEQRQVGLEHNQMATNQLLSKIQALKWVLEEGEC